MPKGFYKDITAALKQSGFVYLKNAKGSHEWWFNEDLDRKVLVPKNAYSRHTANGIMKDAGIKRKF